VHLGYTDALQSLRAELRRYFADVLTDEVRSELAQTGESGPLYRPLVRRLGRDGWLGIGWPTEYGGQGRSPLEQFVFFEEAMRAGAPVPMLSLNTVGPMLMRFGTEEQRRRFLPPILSGELTVAVGYSEPGAGTDLAALRTRAVRSGEVYRVTGSKVFTSHAHDADYIWLACRTDPSTTRHHGLSILLVPTETAGLSITPIHTVGGVRTNTTRYDDVVVPVENRVGPEDDGWRLITAQLNHERVALAAFGGFAYRLWEEVRAWATDEGTPARITVPWVRSELARAWALLDAMKLRNWRLASDVTADRVEPARASAAKVYATECLLEVYRCLLQILGPAGYLPPGSPGAVLHGEVERAGRAAQVNTFAGGVNEIQRHLVATHGLGLPRAAR
jgi:alkylation response protein AidB-like acyl-CoA dehydrogenase